MKKFKTKRVGKQYKEMFIILIALFIYGLFKYYNRQISPKIMDVATTKIEEVTNLYIKNNIIPESVNVDRLINVNKNKKDEILYVDIETTYANELMAGVVKKIQQNIFDFEINDELMKKKGTNVYIEVPLFMAFDGVLFSNMGPKVPIKLTFYEHAFGNIEVELVNYGINNAMIKVFLEIIIEQKIYVPYKEEKLNKTFRLLIGSKIITGTVPNIYGGSINKTLETPSMS